MSIDLGMNDLACQGDHEFCFGLYFKFSILSPGDLQHNEESMCMKGPLLKCASQRQDFQSHL